MLVVSNIIGPAEIFWLLVFGVFAMVVARVVGVFRRHSILGPMRIADPSPLWPLLLITCVGGGSWLGAQIVYGAVVYRRYGELSPERLSPSDLAILATVPACFGLIILLLGDGKSRAKLLPRLGLTLDRLIGGI